MTERARRFGLVGRVSAQAPPFLIAHGDRDHIVAVSEGEALHDALSRSGADTTFLLIGGEGHEGPRFDEPAVLAMTAAWLRAKLLTSANPLSAFSRLDCWFRLASHRTQSGHSR